ncbi:MAG: hypothetical protein V4507_14885 [Verrucomicrobiota bacterium]
MKTTFCVLTLMICSFYLHPSSLDEVDQLIQAGKGDTAVERMREEVKKTENDPLPLYNFGITLYRVGRYEEALRILQAIDPKENKDLQAKLALQQGNIQFRLAQQLKKSGPSAGGILSMERALGYYESANQIKAGKESKNNQQVASIQLEDLLLEVSKSQVTRAERLSSLNKLPEEEHELRDALQARQRALELNSENHKTSQLIEETTARLVTNLMRQGEELGKEADVAKESRNMENKRQQAIAKLDDAVVLDPTNKTLASAREEQIKKMSAMLTDEAEKQAAVALAKPELKLNAADEKNLERAKSKLDEAMTMDATNTKATELNQQILEKMEESHVNQGNEALKAAETAETAQKKLDAVKKAAEQFEKALEQNSKNQSAQEGLKKAEAQLSDLNGEAGQEALAKAQSIPSGGASSTAELSSQDLQKTTDLLNKAVQNLDAALALKPGEGSYQKSLEQAQKMLDATHDEINKRALTHNGEGTGQNPSGGREGDREAKPPGDGKMLPLSLNNGGSQRPVTQSKFWNKKIRDW